MSHVTKWVVGLLVMVGVYVGVKALGRAGHSRCFTYDSAMRTATGRTDPWRCTDDGEHITYHFPNRDIVQFGPVAGWSVK